MTRQTVSGDLRSGFNLAKGLLSDVKGLFICGGNSMIYGHVCFKFVIFIRK
jgi:hypothetical protein